MMKYLFFSLIPFLLPSLCFAQSYSDYPEFPELSYSVIQTELDIKYDWDSGTFSGTVMYALQSKREHFFPINLLAFRTEVKAVQIADKPGDFSIHGDTLRILPEQNNAAQFELRVAFQSSPLWGVHRYGNSLLATSFLPYAQAHIFPSFAHPAVRSRFTLHMETDKRFTLVASGNPSEPEDLLNGRIRQSWVGVKEMSHNQFGFALGTWNKHSFSKGVKTLHYFGFGEKDNSSTFFTAMEEAAAKLKTSWPVESVSVVELPNLHWEDKPFGQGLMYAGSDSTQWLTGIYGQWLGASVSGSYASWKQRFLPLIGEFSESPQPNESIPELHEAEGIWKLKDNSGGEDQWSGSEKKTLAKNIAGKQGYLSETAFDEQMFELFGSLASFAKVRNEVKNSRKARLSVKLSESEDSLMIEWLNPDSLGFVGTLTIDKISASKDFKIRLSDSLNGMTIHVQGLINNFSLQTEKPASIRYQKPAFMWVEQLRSAPKVELRILATEGLRRHLENPDLQLALLDQYKTETSDSVKAAILGTLAEHMKGGMGTVDQFLKEISNPSPLIRQAAVRSLRFYPNNEEISGTLRTRVLRDSVSYVRRAALETLVSHSDTSAILRTLSVAPQRLEQLGLLEEVIEILPSFFMEEELSERLNIILSADVGVKFRADALRLLVKSGGFDSAVFDKIHRDNDPRLRYLAWYFARRENLKPDAETLYEEYDPRVLYIRGENLQAR